MATEVLQTTDAAGNNVYFAIWNTSGNVFDFNDNTFKALGSATTPYVAATENTGQGGVSESGYRASVNLSNINSTLTVAAYIAEAYRRLGGSPVLTTDVLLAREEMRVSNGTLTIDGSSGQVVCECDISVRTTAGVDADLVAWLERDGQRVVLAAGSCSITVTEKDSGVDQWTVTDAAPNADGVFEMSKNLPAFTSDRIYIVKVSITENGTTWVTYHSFKPIG